MKKIAIINHKGGTGKTTTAAALAHIFADRYKKNILIVDADAQNNISTLFGHHDSNNMLALLTGETMDVVEPVEDSEGLSIVPSGYNINGLTLGDVDLSALQRLTENEEDSFDAVVIDCPPGFTPASIAALMAADTILIPMTGDKFAVDGMAFLLEQITGLKGGDKAIKNGGVFLNRWETGNKDVFRDIEAAIRAKGWPVLDTHVRNSPKVLESSYTGAAVTDYSTTSAASRDFFTLAQELVEKWGWRHG